MKIISKLFVLIIVAVFASCSDDTPQAPAGGGGANEGDNYTAVRMQKLKFSTELPGDDYSWVSTGPDGGTSLVSTAKECIFLAKDAGEYNLKLTVKDGSSEEVRNFAITVKGETDAYSPYMATVYEFVPAPGQFVNIMPEYENGDTKESMCRKVEESVCGPDGGLVSLGSCGGYMVFGFDHTVVNVAGKKDFAIYGNSIYNENENGQMTSASSEPGVVYVSLDVNQNGIPDDPWYELAGSEYSKPEVIKGYQITYKRPVEGKTPIPDPANSVTDKEYISWTDNHGGTGYVEKNMFHAQNYYPAWISADELTYTVSLLPQNGYRQGTGPIFIQKPYDWGYVDNWPNNMTDKNSFDISWAVDSEGNKVNLSGADFIKVVTGVIQMCGWIGETSTEISSAKDLHL